MTLTRATSRSRLWPFLLQGLLLAGMATAALLVARPRTRPLVQWQAVAPGLDRATVTAGDGVTKILLFRFQLARFHPEVVVAAGAPLHAETVAGFRQRVGAVAAVNGGFFDPQGVPLGLRVARGVTRFPLRPHADWGVLTLEPGRARIVHTKELRGDEHFEGAIQVGPRLLASGAALKLKPQLARRTAVALERDGRALTLVVVPTPIEAGDLAARLVACGFESALLLDGGPSTQLAFEAAGITVDVPGAYPVPDLLAIFEGPSP